MARQIATRSDWLASHPPDADRLSQTLAGVARQVGAGEDFHRAVREFLDELALRADAQSRDEAIAEGPPTTGDPRHDTYLGALAEQPPSAAAASLSPSVPCTASDRGEIIDALAALAAELERRGVSAEMYVVEAAAVVAQECDLPAGWRNDAVKGFLAAPDPAAAPVLDLPGLRCLAASPATLLALKVLAHRIGEDEDDLRLLARELGLERADQVLAVAEKTFSDRLDPAACFFVEQVFEAE